MLRSQRDSVLLVRACTGWTGQRLDFTFSIWYKWLESTTSSTDPVECIHSVRPKHPLIIFHVRRCWLPKYSSVTFWFLFYFGDLFVYIILLGYITKRSSFKKMLRYSRNTLISLRNGWKSWRTTLTPIQASLHPPLSSQTWNELKSLNLLSSRRGQRGGNHLRCLSRQPFSDRLDNQQCNSMANSLNSSNPLNIPVDTFNIRDDLHNQKQQRSLNQQLNFCLFNSRSVRNKILSVKDYTVDHDIDIFALTETWLEPGDSDRLLIEELIPSGYRFLHNPRSIGRGGGVGMLFKNSLRVKQEETIVTDSFEYMQIICNTSTKSFRIIVIYRPPNGSFANFCLDFSGLLERLSTFGSLLLITGDFNIHLDQPEVPSASKFQRLLKSFGLIQHVYSPTHRSQHTLDLLITRSSDCTLSDIHVHDMGLSDHFAVHSVLPLAKPPRETTRIVYRKLRRIDLASFSSDLQACLAITPAKDLSAFIDHYNTTLQDILNKHAPEKTKVITVRTSAPWYSDKIDAGKKLRRKLAQD